MESIQGRLTAKEAQPGTFPLDAEWLNQHQAMLHVSKVGAVFYVRWKMRNDPYTFRELQQLIAGLADGTANSMMWLWANGDELPDNKHG